MNILVNKLFTKLGVQQPLTCNIHLSIIYAAHLSGSQGQSLLTSGKRRGTALVRVFTLIHSYSPSVSYSLYCTVL